MFPSQTYSFETRFSEYLSSKGLLDIFHLTPHKISIHSVHPKSIYLPDIKIHTSVEKDCQCFEITCIRMLEHRNATLFGTHLYYRDQQTFSVKGQLVDISGFAGHVVSVATTQLCLCNMKEAINKWVWPSSNKTLFTQAGRRLDLAHRL